MPSENIHFADGLDTPDRLAFGLGAAQLATVVAGLLSAYALLRAGLPRPVGIPLAVFVAMLAACMGWLRISGRPSLEWAVFGALFLARAREGSLLIVPPPRAPRSSATPPTPGAAAGTAEATEPSADGQGIVVPLFGAPRWNPRRAARRVIFFSLKGGVGRTTLSVELACWLASCARRDGPGAAPLRVALVELDERSPSVAVRLGIRPPLRRGGARGTWLRVMHRTGLQVVPALTHDQPIDRLLSSLDEDGFDVIVLDVTAELRGDAVRALELADDIFVVINPTPTGVHDAYRTTEALRRAGFRDRLACVVNRARRGVDLSETLADLGVPLVAEVCEDPAVVAAEETHAPASLDPACPIAGSVGAIAEFVLRGR